MFLVGTSGYQYKNWYQPYSSFYPKNYKNILSHYSSYLSFVEINYTFYNTPTQKQIQYWNNHTPSHFKFLFKIPKKISHTHRITNSTLSLLDDFWLSMSVIQDKCIGLLFQFPSTFTPFLI
jgi:uncharacterized protein YecE (DUF72 family)